MAGTRRSNRVAESGKAPVYNEDILEGKIPRSTSGKKRKTESGSSPAAKKGKKAPEEKQQTLEESLDESVPAPPMAENTELADVIEKSKTEVSGPNGDHEVPPQEPAAPKDIEMKEAPAAKNESEKPTFAEPTHTHTESKAVEATPAKAEPDSTQPPEPKVTEATSVMVEHEPVQPIELTEDPVEIQGGKEQPSAENGAPVEVKASEEALKPETNGTAPSESKEEKPMDTSTSVGNAVETKAPDHNTPASILEKGILYFLFRGRVGVDEPHGSNDIARTYLVMRPVPHDAKLTDGPIGDTGNCRVLALPKKTLPVSGKDRFMIFVEKAKSSFDDLKSIFSASEYETKTLGTRHTPAMTPVGEAVYAIISTGRESHLAYILTIPDQISQIQKDLGLKERGSFIISTKNPEGPSPANASLPRGPDYPKEMLDEFKGLRWMPSKSKHLEYANSQLLIIGESIDRATVAQPEDEKKDKDTPLEEMEKLEGEDEIRVKHLKGNDAIFVDLEMSKKDFPKLASTW